MWIPKPNSNTRIRNQIQLPINDKTPMTSKTNQKPNQKSNQKPKHLNPNSQLRAFEKTRRPLNWIRPRNRRKKLEKPLKLPTLPVSFLVFIADVGLGRDLYGPIAIRTKSIQILDGLIYDRAQPSLVVVVHSARAFDLVGCFSFSTRGSRLYSIRRRSG